MKLAKLTLSALLFCAAVASADTITEFTVLYSQEPTVHIVGTDSAGDSIDATFTDDDTVPDVCPCIPGHTIHVLPGLGGVGFALINGVGYGGTLWTGTNELGTVVIDGGPLPPITDPAGTHLFVTFPITWSFNVSLRQQGAVPFEVSTLFNLQGSGTGIAFADMDILDQGGGNLVYEQDSAMTFTSVPEASTGALLALGLAGLTLRKRASAIA
jgi:hypothetical protein